MANDGQVVIEVTADNKKAALGKKLNSIEFLIYIFRT